jgi:branched-subunit amino acid transport protein AzlD
MALNRKLDFGPQEDELDVLREKCAKHQLEKEAFQKQIKALQDRLKLPKAPRPSVQPKKSSIFLVIAALLVAARVLLFIVVEKSRPTDLGGCVNWVFGSAIALMLAVWFYHDTKTERWLVAGPLIWLAATILISVSIFDPVLVQTGEFGPVQHPLIAAAALFACLLSAASRVMYLVMAWLLLFVTDPRKALTR